MGFQTMSLVCGAVTTSIGVVSQQMKLIDLILKLDDKIELEAVAASRYCTICKWLMQFGEEWSMYSMLRKDDGLATTGQ